VRKLGAALVVALALGGVGLTPPAGAQGPSGAAGSKAPAPDPRSPDQLRKEVTERMRALRAFKIVDELKLDETASARLFPILAKYDERQMALAAERREVARELKAELDSPHPDDARIAKHIDRLLANRARRHALQDEQLKELRKVLTPVQQGKLALLLPRLERDFARWIREVTEKND
jgi:Spy/CpxP family protein refolding chaperone